MLDLNLLRIVKRREELHKIYGKIKEGVLTPQSKTVLTDMHEYFKKFPEHEELDLGTFMTFFYSRHPKLTPEQRSAYAGVLAGIKPDVSDQVRSGIMEQLLQLRMAGQLEELLQRYEDGDVSRLHEHVMRVNDAFHRDARIQVSDFIRTGIGDLLVEEENNVGLSWRLECLNRSMRPLRFGDFGIIAGRPDRGKTTLVASEITHFATQHEYIKDRPIMWLNNEGMGKKIIPRLYQASLGYTMRTLIDEHRSGRLETSYTDMMGMPYRVRIFDVHGYDCYQIEQLIEKHNPSVVVYDMIDNIRGFKDAARNDIGLEMMYQWGRELTVKYDHVGIATSQISNEGDGMQFPTLGMLKDSKTGKQGACDFQLMIGASNDAGLQKLRYISLPKNKLRREGAVGDPRETVAFKPEIARFEDIIIDETEDTE